VAGQAQAIAQTWPDKPITFIVPFAAGGGTDAFARPLAAQLDAQLGKRVLIENRAGAGGTVGASAASKAAPDGYTFFMGAAHHAIASSLYPNLDYNIEKDFIAVALIARPPQVVVVNPDKVAAKTLAEFIAYAKANPGKLNYGSAGAGTTHHLAGELFKTFFKTDSTSSPSLTPRLFKILSPATCLLSSTGSVRRPRPSGPDSCARSPSPRRNACRHSPIFRPPRKRAWLDMKCRPGTACSHQRTRRRRSSIRWSRNCRRPCRHPPQEPGNARPDVLRSRVPRRSKMVSAEVERWRKVVKEANVKLD
jgi:hypothetical protein